MEEKNFKNLSNEELATKLAELRKDKSNNSSFRINNQNFAMCYSMRISPYSQTTYFGKRICSHCGKEFGENFDDIKNNCKEKMYSFYLKSDGDLSKITRHPCLSRVTGPFMTREKEQVINYLKEHNLTYTDNKFNRLLTQEEWNYLVEFDCAPNFYFEGDEPTTTCFKYSSEVKLFENKANEYIKNGFDCRLNFNCSDCIELGIPFLEFEIKIGDKNVKSYPLYGIRKKNIKYSSIIDYSVALEFLKGNNTYDKLLDKFDNLDREIVTKQKIDIALSRILGLDIKYNKKEVINTILNFVKENDMPESEAITILNTILNIVDDDYSFSLDESLIIQNIFVYYSKDELSNFSRQEKLIIIEKLARNNLYGNKQSYNKKEVYGILNAIYPETPSYISSSSTYMSEYEKFECQQTKFIHESINNLLFNLYSEQTDSYCFDIDTFKKFLEKLHDTILADKRTYDVKNSNPDEYKYDKFGRRIFDHTETKTIKKPDYDIFSFKYADLLKIIKGETE